MVKNRGLTVPETSKWGLGGGSFAVYSQGASAHNLQKTGDSQLALLVKSGMQHSDEEMGEVRGALVHLQPAHHTVVGKILGDPRFGDAQVIGQLRPDGLATAGGAAPYQVGNGYPQGLAGFDIVIRREIGIGQHPYSRAGWRLICR